MLMLGSVAFGNVARAVLGFALDNEAEDGSCVITTVKNNLGRLDLPSLRYRIDEATIDTDEGPASVGRLVMLGESDRSVHDILRDRGNGAKDDGLEFRSVDVWLTELLTEGPMWATDVYAAADGAGYTKDKAKAAKERLPITAAKDGYQGPWYWTLAAKGSAEPPKNSKSAGHNVPPPLHPLDGEHPTDAV
jgi:hypothetical protein